MSNSLFSLNSAAISFFFELPVEQLFWDAYQGRARYLRRHVAHHLLGPQELQELLAQPPRHHLLPPLPLNRRQGHAVLLGSGVHHRILGDADAAVPHMAAWRAISSPFASADLGLSRLFLFFDLFSFFDSFSGLWGCLVMPTPHLTPSPGTCSSSSSIIFINSERDRGIPSDLTPLDIPLETLDMLRQRRVRGWERIP